jgi:phospholipid-binding lipoprotein MlaA
MRAQTIVLTALVVMLQFELSLFSVEAQPDPFSDDVEWDESSSDKEAYATPVPDPLEPFNQAMFTFNRNLDEYVLLPVATRYAQIIPEGGRRGLGRFFDNLGVIPRFANSLFQAKFNGAGREAGRFVVNTTAGGLGFFDVADSWLGWKASPEDFGQTLGHYGAPLGAYLMLPFFGPSSVRDTVGLVADSAMNPTGYFLSFVQTLAIHGGVTLGDTVNRRSLNLELFEDADRFSLDLYGAVQDGYLQQRERAIEE